MQVTELGTWQLHSHPKQTQLFHDLGGQEWTDFVADVKERGIQQPITVSRKANGYMIVDGHQRVRAARDLKLKNVPAVVVEFADEAAETLALVMANIRRRHLSREERRQVIAEMLKLYPEKSNRQHAETLGVDHKTVKAQRQEMESTGEIPQLDKTTGADGKTRTVTPKRHEPVEPEDVQEAEFVEDAPTLEEGKQALKDIQTIMLRATQPEPWEVDHFDVPTTTTTPIEKGLEAVGWDEAQRFEGAARKVIEGLTVLTGMTAGQLLSAVNSPAGVTLHASIRMGRMVDLITAFTDLVGAVGKIAPPDEQTAFN